MLFLWNLTPLFRFYHQFARWIYSNFLAWFILLRRIKYWLKNRALFGRFLIIIVFSTICFFFFNIFLSLWFLVWQINGTYIFIFVIFWIRSRSTSIFKWFRCDNVVLGFIHGRISSFGYRNIILLFVFSKLLFFYLHFHSFFFLFFAFFFLLFFLFFFYFFIELGIIFTYLFCVFSNVSQRIKIFHEVWLHDGWQTRFICICNYRITVDGIFFFAFFLTFRWLCWYFTFS